MAKPVILKSRKFATQTAALDFVRDQILHGYNLDQVVSDPDHHQLLLELNERHKDAEEKTGVGIREFFIRKTEAGGLYPVSANARASGSEGLMGPRSTGATGRPSSSLDLA
jgi:hypothetical protein